MPKGDVETVYADGVWTNTVEGESDIGAYYQTKDRAVEAGRELAIERKVEHVIKNQDGTISERNSYGHDPRDVEG